MLKEANSITDDALIAMYVTWLDRSRNRTAATLRSYGGALRHWLEYLGGRGVLSATVPRMELFVTRTRGRKERSPAPATVALEVTILRSFYQWCWEQGWAGEHLARALHGPRIPHRDPKPISDQDWMRIWSRDLPPRTRVVLGLAYFCGLRRYELWHLQTAQLGEHAVHDFIRKGGGEHTHRWDQPMDVYERSATLRPLLIDRRLLTDSIVQLRSSGTQWVCEGRGRGLHINTFNVWWRRQMPSGITTTPHMARHSCATNLVRACIPAPLVMGYMNHTSMDVTMGYVRAQGSELGEWLSHAPIQ